MRCVIQNTKSGHYMTHPGDITPTQWSPNLNNAWLFSSPQNAARCLAAGQQIIAVNISIQIRNPKKLDAPISFPCDGGIAKVYPRINGFTSFSLPEATAGQRPGTLDFVSRNFLLNDAAVTNLIEALTQG